MTQNDKELCKMAGIVLVKHHPAGRSLGRDPVFIGLFVLLHFAFYLYICIYYNIYIYTFSSNCVVFR